VGLGAGQLARHVEQPPEIHVRVGQARVQMRLANAFCRFLEVAREVPIDSQAGLRAADG